MAINVVINQRYLQIQLKQLETVWQTVINNYNLSRARKSASGRSFCASG